jgi:apolipoprotein N-acyltransferase
MCVRWRLPLAVIFPVVLVANEILRAWVMTGFPWFFLSHSHYQVHTMIQISDLVGAYGLSFVIAMVNGWVADLVVNWLALRSRPWLLRRRLLAASSVLTATTVLLTIAYGRYRMATEQLVEGPRVAVVQGDYPSLVLAEDNDSGANGEPAPAAQDKLREYLKLALSASVEKPDVIAFPETAWGDVLNREFLDAETLIPCVRRVEQLYSRHTDAILRGLAKGNLETINKHLAVARQRPLKAGPLHRTHVVIGAFAYELFPTAVYPKIKRYNSAYLYEPTGLLGAQRYDKVHLVMFGEFVPFRYGPLHFVYEKLNSITPWGQNGTEYSLTAGEKFRVFAVEADSQDGRKYRFGVPICYEDCMPYVCRAFVANEPSREKADFLLNISNDGWFGHSAEHIQHLAISVFRAVENRVAIARAVNTGVSGFIDPLGRTHGLVSREGKIVGKGIAGVSVQELKLSRRTSFYTGWGDWFGYLCCLLAGLAMVESVMARLLRYRKHHA